MIWLGVIIGIVIMQIATLWVAYLTNENEEKQFNGFEKRKGENR